MANESWSLEIVKGKEVGKVFAVAPGPSILGSGINGEPGIDLGSQEGASIKRMAGRQAKLVGGPNGLVLSDLDSPGGTFVNHKRLLKGQIQPLAEGDLLQLGGVMLKVTKSRPTASVTKPPASSPTTIRSPLTQPYIFVDGTTCRTWDDFLVASSRSWLALRTELTSGKLEQFLRSNGHADLVPPGPGLQSSDDRLDAWLGSLPTTKPSAPEIDVHPSIIRVKATPGGGSTRVKLLITNVGYRLLRSTIRLESPGVLNVGPEWTAQPFVTSEQTEVPITVEIPENVDTPISSTFRVESNGGDRRIEVRIEPSKAAKGFETESIPEPSTISFDFSPWIAKWAIGPRIACVALALTAIRAALWIIDLVSGTATPGGSFGGSIMAIGGLSALIGGRYGWAREGVKGAGPTALASTLGGVFLATLLHAIRMTIEPSGASSGIIGCLLWGGLGIGLALLSVALIPSKPQTTTNSASQ